MTDGNQNDDAADDLTEPFGRQFDRTPEELEEDAALGEAADALGRVAEIVAENLRMVRTLPRDRREHTLRRTALLLGELGDLSHEHRRALIRFKGFKLF